MDNTYTYTRGKFPLLTKLVLILMVLALFCPAVATPSITDKIDSGRQALSKQDFEQAKSLFLECLEYARNSEDREWETKSLFYLAVTLQQQGRAAESDSVRVELFSQAEDYYRECLSLRPDWGPVLNNLAEMYASSGRNSEAAEMYRRAVAADDPKRPLYSSNYAEFLVRNDQWKEATKHLSLTVDEQPWNKKAYERLLELYLENDRSALLEYLWDSVDQGNLSRAQSGALESLSAGSWREWEQRELLTILVVCLSQQHYEPDSFADTDAGRNLEEMGDSPIQEGIEQIFRLHRGQDFDPGNYGWWRWQVEIYREARRGVWPLEGFRMLIRSLGDWYRGTGAVEEAEAYYRLAAKLNPEDPDPEAYASLADLYVDMNNLDALRDLMEEEEWTIFKGKEGAYRGSRIKKIYQFHRTLGIIYSYLGRWESDWEPASAIFQLEHALETVDIYNDSTEPGESMEADPRLISLLAKAYHEAGNTEKAIEKYEEAQRVSIQTENKLGEAQALYGTGIVYQSEGEYTKALDYYMVSSGIQRNIGNKEGELKSYRVSLEIQRELGDRKGEAVTLSNIGGVHEAMGNYEAALETYSSSLEVAREVGDSETEAKALNGIQEATVRAKSSDVELVTYREEIELLKKKIEECEAKSKRLAKPLKDYEAKNRRLAMQLKEYQEEIKKLRAKIEEYGAENRRLAKQLRDCQGKTERRSDELK